MRGRGRIHSDKGELLACTFDLRYIFCCCVMLGAEAEETVQRGEVRHVLEAAGVPRRRQPRRRTMLGANDETAIPLRFGINKI